METLSRINLECKVDEYLISTFSTFQASKIMQIRSHPSRAYLCAGFPVDSCASSFCAGSIGVRFLSICTRFRTRKGENKVRQLNIDSHQSCTCRHVAMVILVSNLFATLLN